ncbi:MAG: iron chelate uptake ABC transporter family permease subunit [Verrucomicrobiia bacterium]
MTSPLLSLVQALLPDFNTRIVLAGVTLLGAASGWIGTFLLLRKRALLGDALSHATLPGIALAFCLMLSLGGSGKWLPGLLLGAALSGALGCITILALRRIRKIDDDAAMGIVLSVFFGAGVVLLGWAQAQPGGSAAGLESFIYGKTASMVQADVLWITLLSALALLTSLLLFKELRLLCFDEAFGRATGWPMGRLDLILATLVTLVTVAGLQAVGLILVIAFLITPAAAARFWTHRLGSTASLAAIMGALCGAVGASLSALLPKAPAGAIIVLTTSVCFAFSLLFGTKRGLLPRWLEQHRQRQRMKLHHLLRAAYETIEHRPSDPPPEIPIADLLRARSWTRPQIEAVLRQAEARHWIRRSGLNSIQLTPSGLAEATRITRTHRLWEAYLIHYADIAPSHVDRDADAVEHILRPEIIAELEAALSLHGPVPSPHPTQRHHP